MNYLKRILMVILFPVWLLMEAVLIFTFPITDSIYYILTGKFDLCYLADKLDDLWLKYAF